MTAVVTMRQLLESGVHFGHQTRRWNPKMKRFIFTERNGIYIIDLQQSLDYIDRAYEFIKETVAHGGTILYVGTKKQAQEAIAEQARRVGMPFVNQRWLGGMLTNFGTVFKRLQRLKELEEVDFDDVAGSTLTKKELLHLKRERDKLDRSLGGIRHMTRVPSAIWVVDTKKEHIAVSEARKLGIPVIAILDTNCDPDEVTYPIPGNDDAIRSVALLTRVIADAVADGLIARAGAADGEEKPATALDSELGSAEPLAEWERELLPSRPADETGTRAANGVDVAANGSATAPPDSSPAEAAPADTVPADAAPAEAVPAETASAEAATPETAAATPETAASEAAAPEAATPETAAPEAAAPETAASEAAAPEAAAPETAASEAAAPEAAAPETAASEAAAPEAAAPETAASEAAAPEAASNGAAGADAAGTEPADSGARAATGTPAGAEAPEASPEA
jgi:small subunit ribosomal protein S2